MKGLGEGGNKRDISGNNQEKPWGGRFKEGLHKSVETFTASLPFDRRLAGEDIQGSMAHCRMLMRTGILGPGDGELILKGLGEIDAEIIRGDFPYDLSLEDIHMNIEKRLIDKIGPAGGKLHTARSRNDQVALDLHLYVKKELAEANKLIFALQKIILELAEQNMEVIIPGYTHLQRAQPVLLSHHLLAYFWMLQRDRERFIDACKRADLMPLGAGALSGTSFPIDREAVACELGFQALYENSMDAVSDRDFVLEYLSCACFLLMHLSRFSEELILWSSHEFSFLELGDAFTTGSSMMPQKKNPDVPELVRAKTGRVYGNLLALFTVFKGLPLTYNKDMQEDKEPLFDTADTLKGVLNVFVRLLKSIRVCREKISRTLQNDFSTATELADFLALQGLPFREAHHVVGRLVRHCLDTGKLLMDLSQKELSAFHPLLGSAEASNRLSPASAVKAKKSRGGTAPETVEKQLQAARAILKA